MSNSDVMSLRLTRGDACRLLTALTHICFDFRDEIRDPSTSADRREICRGSLAMWERIHDDIDRQIDAFDASQVPGLTISEALGVED